MKFIPLTIALTAATIPCASAVEGAMGRPISGAGVNPYAGVVPPSPGWLLGVGELYYTGEIGGGGTIPVGVNLTLDLEMKASFTPITLTYIWDTKNPRWNFASAVSLPIVWLEAEADVTIGPLAGKRKEDAFGLFDITLAPIVASYHISQTEHVSFGLTIWAPTGKYDEEDLANLGMNKWTFIPTVSYTKVFAATDIEFSASLGVNFSTENHDTDYEDGILTDLEFTAIKRFQSGFGAGIVGSWIEQVTDDEGGAADAINGFRGRAFGVGPLLTYSTKIGDSHLDLNVRWVHEFENKKRMQGDLFALAATLKF